jgi:hypothetical protein
MGKMAALLTRMSTWPPPSSLALRANDRAESALHRSAATKSALPPLAQIEATTAAVRS